MGDYTQQLDHVNIHMCIIKQANKKRTAAARTYSLSVPFCVKMKEGLTDWLVCAILQQPRQDKKNFFFFVFCFSG